MEFGSTCRTAHRRQPASRFRLPAPAGSTFGERPARRSTSLRPAWSLNRPGRPFVAGVLQPMSLPPSPAQTATGWSDSCRAGFAPAEKWRLSRRTRSPVIRPCNGSSIVVPAVMRELKALVKERAEMPARIDREWKLLMVRETELAWKEEVAGPAASRPPRPVAGRRVTFVGPPCSNGEFGRVRTPVAAGRIGDVEQGRSHSRACGCACSTRTPSPARSPTPRFTPAQADPSRTRSVWPPSTATTSRSVSSRPASPR